MRNWFKRKPSWNDIIKETTIKKKRWLEHTLFNKLYHDHHELWPWIKRALAEYKNV